MFQVLAEKGENSTLFPIEHDRALWPPAVRRREQLSWPGMYSMIETLGNPEYAEKYTDIPRFRKNSGNFRI